MEPLVEAIRVSIDVGCHSHRVAVGLSNGEVVDEFDVNHASQGFDDFFSRIDGHQRRYGGEVLVAMEGYNGWARHFRSGEPIARPPTPLATPRHQLD